MNIYDIVKRPILSEKSYDGIAYKVYTFEVDRSVTKTEIKRAVEEIFEVKVAKVNISNHQGKLKTMGRTSGRRPSYKKAVVTLTEDSKGIEFFESLA